MKTISRKYKVTIAIMLAFVMMTMPVCAADGGNEGIAPCFNNVSTAVLGIDFDMSNVVYCSLNVSTYAHGSGVSGIMKLFDSSGNCLAVWPVSDYEQPIACEFTYQGSYGATYTVTFEGHAYSNNGTPSDWLELSISGTCRD